MNLDLEGPVTQENLQNAEQYRVLFISGRTAAKNPLDETYWDMLKFSMCPVFVLLSITTLILVADLAIFITEVSIGFNPKSSNLLAVNANTQLLLGANEAYRVYRGQVYRLLSAIFGHGHFMHIFSNMLFTFMFLSRIEYTLGWWKTLIVYLLSGIAGNIFSIACSPSGIKIGASTALYGVIGIIIGYIIINWSGLSVVGPIMKSQVVCSGLIIILSIFIFTPTAENLDYYGHGGGFIGGLFLISIHDTIYNNTREKVLRIVFAVCYCLFMLGCFLGFYLRPAPTQT